MPVSRIFTYEVAGLSYTVTVYEEGGKVYADITVLEGAMDVNAVYFGDDDFSGQSASLGGPHNMNGAALGGERVQWDGASRLSEPGLGREGTEKETFVSAGDTLTIELDVDSVDEIDVFGIRATSTTTEEGSIKAVSDDPQEPEDPDEPTFEKVFFGTQLDENGGITDGVAIVAEPQEGYSDALPDGTEATFENYLAYYENEADGYDVQSIQTVVFYTFHEDGYPVELFRIDAPEDGFQDSEDLLAAYDEAIESGALDPAEDGDGGLELMAALSFGPGTEDPATPEDDETTGDLSELVA